MGNFTVETAGLVYGSAEAIYQVLIDYVSDDGHRAIVPPRYFKEIKLIEGGIGNGTEVDVTMAILGQEQTTRLSLHEVEKNRILVEGNEEIGLETTFLLEPVAGDPNTTNVTIRTVGQTSSGLQGWIEGYLVPMVLRRVYKEELEILHQHMQQKKAVSV